MFNRCLIVLIVVLSASCVSPAYKPSPETLGPNPATLRVSTINGDITRSGILILKQEVNCKRPGKTLNKIAPLGFTETLNFKALSREPPYSVQIPSNQTILINLDFRINLPDEGRLCDIAFSFVPEPGAVYLLDRRFNTSTFNRGECGFDLSRVVVTEQGETITKLKNYRWGPPAAFEGGRYICDASGNYTIKLPPGTNVRMPHGIKRPMEEITKATERSPSAKAE